MRSSVCAVTSPLGQLDQAGNAMRGGRLHVSKFNAFEILDGHVVLENIHIEKRRRTVLAMATASRKLEDQRS